jgi:hypothetical protein
MAPSSHTDNKGNAASTLTKSAVPEFSIKATLPSYRCEWKNMAVSYPGAGRSGELAP